MVGIVIAQPSYCLVVVEQIVTSSIVVIAGLIISSLIIELAGAGLLLVAFVGQSLGRWGEDAPSFLLLNALGAALLAVVGWTQGALGFAVLNTVWALVALRALGSWYRAMLDG